MTSKRRIRRASCTGKVRFDSAHDAQQAAYAACRRSGQWIVAYGCKFCGGHHIGHPPARVHQAIKARQRAAIPGGKN